MFICRFAGVCTDFPSQRKNKEIEKSIKLTEGSFAADFYPFSQTRPVADIRCGILSIREKWARLFPISESGDNAIEIPANCLPGRALMEAIQKGNAADLAAAVSGAPKLLRTVDIVFQNDAEIRRDFADISEGRKSMPIPSSNRIICPPQHADKKDAVAGIFIEEGAVLEHCILNVTEGPIYIGRNAVVMEGCSIRGPFSLGEGAVVKMGSRIYGATTIGPFCTVGGEIKNSMIFGHSNKAHDGYLGDSVVGEWCNLGAGTSNSNVKNSGGPVKYWNPVRQAWVTAGAKCGLFMGDYSRSAINTSFNTGTVVGVSAHVFGKGLTPAYLSSFSWGFDPGEVYDFEKAIRHIRNWTGFKNGSLAETDIKKLKTIFDQKNNPS